MRTRNSFLLAAAKTAAVAVALGVLAWFVVTEQRRANPVATSAEVPAMTTDPAPPTSDASTPAAGQLASSTPTSADPAVFLSSSKVLAVDAQPGLDEAVFLMGSKSGIATPLATGAEPEARVVPPEPVFLPNSKSRVWTESPLPRPVLSPSAKLEPRPPTAPPRPDPRQR